MAAVRCRTVFITGCNRGLGLEFVKQFLNLNHPPKYLFATCRSLRDSSADELKSLTSQHANLHLLELDVDSETAIRDVAAKVSESVGDDGLDLLVNNAAIINRAKLEEAKAEDMMKIYKTNAVGPLLVTQAMLPLLRLSAKKKHCHPQTAIVNITSIMGSVGENKSGGRYPYRASKAALNIITKSMSVDLASDGIIAVVFHPGYVQTDMGGPGAYITTETSVQGLMEMIGSLNEEKSGNFLDYAGKILPW